MTGLGQSIPVVELVSVDSTNSEAARRLAAGEKLPLWIRAGEQTAGRGRGGRPWISEAGNLYATLMVQSVVPQKEIAQLSLVAAVAVHDTLAHFMDKDMLLLKWPNDCLAESGKIAGILLETLSNAPLTVAVGMGLNIAHAPLTQSYKTSFLKTYAKSATVNSVFAVLNHEIVKWHDVWRGEDGFAAIRAAWIQRSYDTGQALKISAGTAVVSGQFQGLGPDGELLLQAADGTIGRYFAGDVAAEQGHAA